jgi:DNA polymerase-1
MKKLLLIDANSLIHRSFHAIPPLTSKTGEPTGALYGVAGTLLKILKEQKPDYAAAAFDRPEPTFRKEMFKDYKAHRPKAPDELISQIVEAHNLFEKFGINFFEKPGYEADDVIGTFVKKFRGERNLQIVILTGDLDTLQLVNDEKIVVQILKKGVSETMLYDEAAVIKRYGLRPAQMIDYKGLVGDTSDNIPGVRGVGPKTAEEFLKRFGTLEDIFKKLPKTDPAAKKILPFEKEALFSKKLATINCDAPIEVGVGDIKFSGFNGVFLTAYFEKLGFESLVRRLDHTSRGNADGEKPLAQGLFAFEPKEEAEKKPVFIESERKIKRNDGKEEIDVAWDWKPIIKGLIKEKKDIPTRLFDLGVAGWILNSDETDFSPSALTERFLRETVEEKVLMRKMFGILERKIKASGLGNVFYKMEMPLIPILAWMEIWGIKVDDKKLRTLSKDMDKRISELTKKIYATAGSPFNINSSQQIAEVLFEKLKIKPEKNKKTSTGRRSTSEEVLLSLEKENPIASELLSYRETFKIKSTYVEPLLLVREKDGRVRTNFIQTGTTTGRLASEKPNLQNIPQESEWANPLREAFIAEPGFSFASFDYAQIELRLLAHMTMEEKLLRAFEEDQDIHTLTASKVLNIPFEKITHQERRLGKTLNFGVVYGMGPRAFGQSAGVSVSEAKGFIDGYYREFPGIKRWQDKVKMEAKRRGFVENLNGRRRWFWTDARHPKVIGEIERAAVNMPLQSLSADILKMAMIKSFELLKDRGSLGTKAKLILSIHDELLFEIQDDILMETAPLIRKLMEEIYPLAAPLKAEIKTGKNWGSLQKPKNA